MVGSKSLVNCTKNNQTKRAVKIPNGAIQTRESMVIDTFGYILDRKFGRSKKAIYVVKCEKQTKQRWSHISFVQHLLWCPDLSPQVFKQFTPWDLTKTTHMALLGASRNDN
ncbi:hypothetical protein AMECASPLE_014995 [Ameca splendens]|uniref:Uncharacterized protein n=1 Tax=Ameca splendens TaxID=208324 RepID=A0ABV0XEW2_9TELE